MGSVGVLHTSSLDHASYIDYQSLTSASDEGEDDACSSPASSDNPTDLMAPGEKTSFDVGASARGAPLPGPAIPMAAEAEEEDLDNYSFIDSQSSSYLSSDTSDSPLPTNKRRASFTATSYTAAVVPGGSGRAAGPDALAGPPSKMVALSLGAADAGLPPRPPGGEFLRSSAVPLRSSSQQLFHPDQTAALPPSGPGSGSTTLDRVFSSEQLTATASAHCNTDFLEAAPPAPVVVSGASTPTSGSSSFHHSLSQGSTPMADLVSPMIGSLAVAPVADHPGAVLQGATSLQASPVSDHLYDEIAIGYDPVGFPGDPTYPRSLSGERLFHHHHEPLHHHEHLHHHHSAPSSYPPSPSSLSSTLPDFATDETFLPPGVLLDMDDPAGGGQSTGFGSSSGLFLQDGDLSGLSPMPVSRLVSTGSILQAVKIRSGVASAMVSVSAGAFGSDNEAGFESCSDTSCGPDLDPGLGEMSTSQLDAPVSPGSALAISRLFDFDEFVAELEAGPQEVHREAQIPSSLIDSSDGHANGDDDGDDDDDDDDDDLEDGNEEDDETEDFDDIQGEYEEEEDEADDIAAAEYAALLHEQMSPDGSDAESDGAFIPSSNAEGSPVSDDQHILIGVLAAQDDDGDDDDADADDGGEEEDDEFTASSELDVSGDELALAAAAAAATTILDRASSDDDDSDIGSPGSEVEFLLLQGHGHLLHDVELAPLGSGGGGDSDIEATGLVALQGSDSSVDVGVFSFSSDLDEDGSLSRVITSAMASALTGRQSEAAGASESDVDIESSSSTLDCSSSDSDGSDDGDNDDDGDDDDSIHPVTLVVIGSLAEHVGLLRRSSIISIDDTAGTDSPANIIVDFDVDSSYGGLSSADEVELLSVSRVVPDEEPDVGSIGHALMASSTSGGEADAPEPMLVLLDDGSHAGSDNNPSAPGGRVVDHPYSRSDQSSDESGDFIDSSDASDSEAESFISPAIGIPLSQLDGPAADVAGDGASLLVMETIPGYAVAVGGLGTASDGSCGTHNSDSGGSSSSSSSGTSDGDEDDSDSGSGSEYDSYDSYDSDASSSGSDFDDDDDNYTQQLRATVLLTPALASGSSFLPEAGGAGSYGSFSRPGSRPNGPRGLSVSAAIGAKSLGSPLLSPDPFASFPVDLVGGGVGAGADLARSPSFTYVAPSGGVTHATAADLFNIVRSTSAGAGAGGFASSLLLATEPLHMQATSLPPAAGGLAGRRKSISAPVSPKRMAAALRGLSTTALDLPPPQSLSTPPSPVSRSRRPSVVAGIVSLAPAALPAEGDGGPHIVPINPSEGPVLASLPAAHSSTSSSGLSSSDIESDSSSSDEAPMPGPVPEPEVLAAAGPQPSSMASASVVSKEPASEAPVPEAPVPGVPAPAPPVANADKPNDGAKATPKPKAAPKSKAPPKPKAVPKPKATPKPKAAAAKGKAASKTEASAASVEGASPSAAAQTVASTIVPEPVMGPSAATRASPPAGVSAPTPATLKPTSKEAAALKAETAPKGPGRPRKKDALAPPPPALGMVSRRPGRPPSASKAGRATGPAAAPVDLPASSRAPGSTPLDTSAAVRSPPPPIQTSSLGSPSWTGSPVGGSFSRPASPGVPVGGSFEASLTRSIRRVLSIDNMAEAFGLLAVAVDRHMALLHWSEESPSNSPPGPDPLLLAVARASQSQLLSLHQFVDTQRRLARRAGSPASGVLSPAGGRSVGDIDSGDEDLDMEDSAPSDDEIDIDADDFSEAEVPVSPVSPVPPVPPVPPVVPAVMDVAASSVARAPARPTGRPAGRPATRPTTATRSTARAVSPIRRAASTAANARLSQMADDLSREEAAQMEAARKQAAGSRSRKGSRAHTPDPTSAAGTVPATVETAPRSSAGRSLAAQRSAAKARLGAEAVASPSPSPPAVAILAAQVAPPEEPVAPVRLLRRPLRRARGEAPAPAVDPPVVAAPVAEAPAPRASISRRNGTADHEPPARSPSVPLNECPYAAATGAYLQLAQTLALSASAPGSDSLSSSGTSSPVHRSASAPSLVAGSMYAVVGASSSSSAAGDYDSDIDIMD
ncbi:hypothetical protein H696_00176 [Fonticula alba]|uniref:Uncharacterized protein n=1 Tax=Fonticula alba TaxID=691883 RepID=A0A058ZDW0_FONAL|nr:hypothetical protein H696_00176 [Fonticula alba]KCV72585.1 hypothetical protein H696_00176 [Fonticula alba]|eukprot:XP_009492286.1 hypothetical protein H696_00176 [Fonticula alba]